MSSPKWRRVWETIGRVFLDLGKLSFGSLILGTILKGEAEPYALFGFGVFATIFLIVAGIWFVYMSED
jgi:hypothetical protein